jgi:gluconate 2-dehydrogenase gamma chain
MFNLPEYSRRDALIYIGKALALTQVISSAAAQPLLNDHETKTLRVLAALIMPGSLEAGAPEFIDFLCGRNEELAAIFTGGLAWMDGEMRRRGEASFVDAAPAKQTALLDVIAYRKNETPALAPGFKFFGWARNMVVDAYYTSAIGMTDLGYMGNSAVSSFSVPQEAIDYAIKRSSFA